MGVVWLAEQDRPVRRRVALKLINSEFASNDVIARFSAEKQAIALMDHQNIARVLDAGTTNDGRPYFVMELVDGIPITQYCDDNKLSVDERLKLFVSVCKAVQHARQKGIIHRDLKPSNVLVAVIDGEPVPKVIDFGLAKAVEQNLLLTDVTMQTEFGKVVGTVRYMSPEQADLKVSNAQDIDTRTDVYSLGVTATLKGHQGMIYSLAYNPEGSSIATAGYDNTVKLWDVQTGKENRTLIGHTGRVRTVAFDPQGERLVSGGYDPKVRVWDVASGEQIATAYASNGAVFGVAFSQDGKRFATCGTDRFVQLFDAASGREIMSLSTHEVGVSSVAFSPDGIRLAAGTTDGTVKFWDAPREHETTILLGHSDAVTKVTFSSDGSRIYSESENEKLVWDVATREKSQDAVWEPPDDASQKSPNGRWFVTTELNNVVLVDLDFKGTPDEAARRKAKANFDSFWHQKQAKAATTAENWCAATFHFALLMKNEPVQAACYDDLHSSFQKLKSQFEQQGRDIERQLALVVRESLKLPRGYEWTNPSFEGPESRKRSYEFFRTIPGWKTTDQEFEIWSTGFLGVSRPYRDNQECGASCGPFGDWFLTPFPSLRKVLQKGISRNFAAG